MIIILFLSVLTGSPWDWQSMNAKYPSDHSRSNLPAYGSTKPFPEIMPVNANVSVFESHTALLPCRIKQLQEYTVNLGNDFYEYIYMLGCMYKNRHTAPEMVKKTNILCRDPNPHLLRRHLLARRLWGSFRPLSHPTS